MSVFCIPPLDDRGPDVRALSVFRASNRLWRFLRQALAASSAPHRGLVDQTHGWTAADVYVPSQVCRDWASALADAFPHLVVVSRPDPSRGGGLHPVVLLHAAVVEPHRFPHWDGPRPPATDWRTVGEVRQLSSTDLGAGVLAFAAFLATANGMSVTTELPPAPSASFVRELARLAGRPVDTPPVRRSRTTLAPGQEVSLGSAAPRREAAPEPARPRRPSRTTVRPGQEISLRRSPGGTPAHPGAGPTGH